MMFSVFSPRCFADIICSLFSCDVGFILASPFFTYYIIRCVYFIGKCYIAGAIGKNFEYEAVFKGNSQISKFGYVHAFCDVVTKLLSKMFGNCYIKEVVSSNMPDAVLSQKTSTLHSKQRYVICKQKIARMCDFQ